MRYIPLFLSIGLALFAKIIETPHFSDVVKYAAPDSLLILDIDDTLLVPVQTLGTDVWFNHQLVQNRKKAPNEDPLDKTLALWEAIRHLTEIEIVEAGSEKFVATMQKKGIPIMGLTTQGLALATRTVKQLNSLKFDLSRTAPIQEDRYFLNEHGVLYRKGILFTSGTHKGKALLKFLDLANIHPKKVIFINDKQKHLVEVEESLEKAGIPFIGLRYSFSDERVNRFCPELAEIQLRYSSFDQILSDAEAQKIFYEQRAEAAQVSD